MTDPIADLIIRIKNANMAGLKEVDIPYSKFKTEILKVAKKAGYFESIEEKTTKKKHSIVVKLCGNKINHFKRISKPGQKIYVKSKLIPRPLRGFGIVVISTPKGIVSGDIARKENLGGEIICEIW